MRRHRPGPLTEKPPTTTGAHQAGLAYPHPFDALVVALCLSASRQLCILSPRLDHEAFDTPALSDALSALARQSRQTEVRILLQDSRGVVGSGHRLLQLARRLPSAVHMRRLAEHPQWNGETLVLRDRDGLLYKPAGSGHDAFYEPASRTAAQPHLELFEELWRHSDEDPELKSLRL